MTAHRCSPFNRVPVQQSAELVEARDPDPPDLRLERRIDLELHGETHMRRRSPRTALDRRESDVEPAMEFRFDSETLLLRQMHDDAAARRAPRRPEPVEVIPAVEHRVDVRSAQPAAYEHWVDERVPNDGRGQVVVAL